MRPLRAVAALLLAAVMLTGCVKIDMDITVSKESDTVTGSIIVALEKALLTLGGEAPEKAFSKANMDSGAMPAGSRTEVYDDGKYYGKRIIFDKVSFADFNKSSKESTDAPKLLHDGGKYIFTMRVTPAPSSSLGTANAAVANALASVEMKFAITFPGKVIEQDSHAKVEGNTARWSLKLNESYQLRAVAEEPQSIPWLVISVASGLFCLLLVVGAVIFAIRMTRRPRQAQEETVPLALG
jgi:hypothetical protein